MSKWPSRPGVNGLRYSTFAIRYSTLGCGLARLGVLSPYPDMPGSAALGGGKTSASSSLNFGVEPLQFHAGVFDAELPVDAALFGIRFVGPSCDFGLQLGQFTDAAVAQTLA